MDRPATLKTWVSKCNKSLEEKKYFRKQILSTRGLLLYRISFGSMLKRWTYLMVSESQSPLHLQHSWPFSEIARYVSHGSAKVADQDPFDQLQWHKLIRFAQSEKWRNHKNTYTLQRYIFVSTFYDEKLCCSHMLWAQPWKQHYQRSPVPWRV